MSTYKPAKDLQPGDRIMVQIAANRPIEPATVMAAVESTQRVPRKVVIVTLRSTDGRDIHRTYGQLRTLELIPKEDLPS